ncbi:NB-ARC domain-containing protein [Lentzea sp. HUAS12]|uniref:NB-ARC domain-containing protein n=1 Tax=Lentzea sp. HUAS12 TaxID=2951806 RepID=UPI00209E62C9|nr:NB-ARC domain-containing protein [Lentzea sp. HUAS12]USX56270.1 NB-ARC domain-containing protein [Lentzea sp. HUAS12]
MDHQTRDERAVVRTDRTNTDRADFAADLAQLRVACGKPSYETLARLSSRLRRSTIFDALAGKSSPSLEFVVDYVRTCAIHAERISVEIDAGLSDIADWTARWRALHSIAEPSSREASALEVPPKPAATASKQIRQAWPLPRQLPPGNGLLVGRDKEIDRLDTVLGGGLVVVTGMAGVGKTALVTHWAHMRADHFPDGVLWIGSDAGRAPDSPACKLVSMLCSLGLERASLPRTVADLSRLLRSCTAGRKVLLVIDDVAEPEQVRPLLPAEPRCATVVVSRRGLVGLSAREGAHRLVLSPLSSTPAALLLTEVLRHADPSGACLDDGRARELAALCGGLPLALRVAAERLRWDTAAHLREELSSECTRLASLVVADDPENSPRAVLVASIRRLPASAARVLRMITLHPGATCTSASVASLVGATPAEVGRDILLLVQDNLLEQHGPSHFRLHVLVRQAASELRMATETAEEQQAALRRLLAWLRGAADSQVRSRTGGTSAPPPIDVAAAIDWLVARLPHDDHLEGHRQ